jgi:hypothetical protein
MVPSISNMVDYNRPETFIRKILTSEEAVQRLNILKVNQEFLEGENEQLSPRSRREIGELRQVFENGMRGDKPSIKIYRRDPSQFYIVEFTPDSNRVLIRLFKGVSEKLRSLNQVFSSTSQVSGILNVFSQHGQGMDWYRSALQLDNVMKTDFLEGLHRLSAVTSTLVGLTKRLSSTAPSAIIELLSKIHIFYDAQMVFNRTCEMNLLELAIEFKTSAIKLQDEIITCGVDLITVPGDFLPKTHRIVIAASEQLSVFRSSLDSSSTTFLGEMDLIRGEMTSCFEQLRKSGSWDIAFASLEETLKVVVEAQKTQMHLKIGLIEAQIGLPSTDFSVTSSSSPFSSSSSSSNFSEVPISASRAPEEKIEIEHLQDAVNQIGVWCDKIACSHALWLQFYQQSATIQAYRDNEVNLNLLIKEDVVKADDTEIEKKSLLSKDASDLSSVKMIPTVDQLLQRELERVDDLQQTAESTNSSATSSSSSSPSSSSGSALVGSAIASRNLYQSTPYLDTELSLYHSSESDGDDSVIEDCKSNLDDPLPTPQQSLNQESTKTTESPRIVELSSSFPDSGQDSVAIGIEPNALFLTLLFMTSRCHLL